VTPTPVSRRERPAKPPLSRDAIVDVALRLMDADGLERLTMRKLAAALDTGPASLYVYVRNTAELHAAILDRLLLDLEPPAEGDWRERLVAQFSDYTELLFRHPGLARSLVAVRPTGPQFLTFVDRALGELHRGRVPARQAAWGVDLLLQLATRLPRHRRHGRAGRRPPPRRRPRPPRSGGRRALLRNRAGPSALGVASPAARHRRRHPHRGVSPALP
jgi:AcrR family transcriptional regulator